MTIKEKKNKTIIAFILVGVCVCVNVYVKQNVFLPFFWLMMNKLLMQIQQKKQKVKVTQGLEN